MVFVACIAEVKIPHAFVKLGLGGPSDNLISSTALTDVPDPDGPPGLGGGGYSLRLPRSCEVGLLVAVGSWLRRGARPPPGVLGCCQFSGVVRFHGLDLNLASSDFVTEKA